MADILPSAICDDIVTRLRAGLDPIGGEYGPPDGAVVHPQFWVRYQAAFEWGMFEVRQPTVTVTVAAPRGGDYPNEYRYITDLAHQVAAALRGPILIAGECPITDLSISEAAESMYAGAPIMAAAVTITLETKEINNT